MMHLTPLSQILMTYPIFVIKEVAWCPSLDDIHVMIRAMKVIFASSDHLLAN